MKKVLIIDDNPKYLSALIKRLKQEQLDVSVCENGRTAIDYLKSKKEQKEQVDIILLDLELPDIWGIDLIKDIRQYCQAPIVIISKVSDVGIKGDAINAGGFVYLEKDLDPNLHPSEGFKIDPNYGAAQVRKILTNPFIEKTTFSFDPMQQTVLLNDIDLKLSESDYIILKFLYENRNTPQSRSDILDQFKQLVGGNWNEINDYNLNIVSQHINTIRKKILVVAPGFRPIVTLRHKYQFKE